jgi:glutathione S-transferase
MRAENCAVRKKLAGFALNATNVPVMFLSSADGAAFMITLYTFGPLGDQPDASPFVMKTMLLLKLAGLDYVEDRGGFRKAPKGKLPYIDDDGTIVADSAFIRFHLAEKHAADFDGHLSAAQRAIGQAVEKMCEDHLFWLVAHVRWMDDANFEAGPARFFDAAPAFVRPLVKKMIRGKIRKTMHMQGMGRHSDAERLRLGAQDVDALSTLLGDGPYFFGELPSGTDATVFAFVSSLLTPLSASPLRDHALGKANLVAYRDRLTTQYFG